MLRGDIRRLRPIVEKDQIPAAPFENGKSIAQKFAYATAVRLTIYAPFFAKSD